MQGIMNVQGAQGEVYTSVDNNMEFNLNNLADYSKNLQAECEFQSIA
jgi:hypothetical protein